MRFEFSGLGKQQLRLSTLELPAALFNADSTSLPSSHSYFPLSDSLFYLISTAPSAPDPSEIERRITEAADAARAEGEAGLEDLLVCLGEVRLVLKCFDTRKKRTPLFFHPSLLLSQSRLLKQTLKCTLGGAQGRGAVGQARGAGRGRCSTFSRGGAFRREKGDPR